MLKKQPAILLFTGDWKKDPALSKCSAATRGIWIDLLCAMHDNGRTGIVTGTVTELAQMCRCSKREMEKALSQLKVSQTAHVTVRDAKVTVLNRRMNREHKLREGSKLRMRRKRKSPPEDAMLRNCDNASSISSSSSEQTRNISEKKERVFLPVQTLSDSRAFVSENDLAAFEADPTFSGKDIRASFKAAQKYYPQGIPIDSFLKWLQREQRLKDDGSQSQHERFVAGLVRDH